MRLTPRQRLVLRLLPPGSRTMTGGYVAWILTGRWSSRKSDTTLRSLERRGLVRASHAFSRCLWCLTEEGSRLTSEWLNEEMSCRSSTR